MKLQEFVGTSTVRDSGLELALAPALTPLGLIAAPSFFHGFVTHPQVLSRGLLTLADITSTRYYQYVPSALRDPVLTAHGDRLRAECFSACNGVYARLDLLADIFDGGDIAYGTTNVDIGPELRTALAAVRRTELLHLDVGTDGLAVSSPDETIRERPVQMPDRWIRALGNVAELHRGMTHAFTVGRAEARAFVSALPAVTASGRSGWLTPGVGGLRVSPRAGANSVYVAGLHRLGAAKRLLPHIVGMSAYGSPDGPDGACIIEFELPAARLVLGLTPTPSRGHSGEGSLLTALASPTVLDDADLISALLAFEPLIDAGRLARESNLSFDAVMAALAVLAASGRVGWDAHDGAHFHRELPDDPDRVLGDNPRLVSARRLLDDGAVRLGSRGEWLIRSGDVDYPVRLSPDGDTCSCSWYLKHSTGRGPCKHILAARLMTMGPG